MNLPSRLLAGILLALVVTACAQPSSVPLSGGPSAALATPPATLAPALTKPVSTGIPVASSPIPTLPSNNPPATCRITTSPDVPFTPPTPYPAKPPSEYVGEFWYGTADLWTMLQADGIWRNLPHTNTGYTQKVFWWAQDYHVKTEPIPKLTVTGQRLDGAAAPLVASNATNAMADFGTAMLVGVDIPTPGCWEITGHYKGHDLSFVVWVAP